MLGDLAGGQSEHHRKMIVMFFFHTMTRQSLKESFFASFHSAILPLVSAI